MASAPSLYGAKGVLHSGGRPSKLDFRQRQPLLKLVDKNPGATLAELHYQLCAYVHPSTLYRVLDSYGLTFKKMLFASEQDRPDVRPKRACFHGRAALIDPERFVFLDEVGAHTALLRLYGWGPRGERVVDRVPHARWEMTTLISAIRHTGVVASVLFTGATDEAVFLTYLRQVLIPSLRPGEMVVLDNLAAHRVSAVAWVLRQAGFGVWYLPPYSPDFHPIEKIWSKVKSYLRKVEARTTETLWEAIGAALETITATDCLHCFPECGYHATPNRKPL